MIWAKRAQIRRVLFLASAPTSDCYLLALAHEQTLIVTDLYHTNIVRVSISVDYLLEAVVHFAPTTRTCVDDLFVSTVQYRFLAELPHQRHDSLSLNRPRNIYPRYSSHLLQRLPARSTHCSRRRRGQERRPTEPSQNPAPAHESLQTPGVICEPIVGFVGQVYDSRPW